VRLLKVWLIDFVFGHSTTTSSGCAGKAALAPPT
jgi:hypothetical protein